MYIQGGENLMVSGNGLEPMLVSMDSSQEEVLDMEQKRGRTSWNSLNLCICHGK